LALVSTDGPARRREIENSTAARLAEIVAGAERAAKQVIDEAEAEARSRLTDAEEEADRIVAERLAGLAELTDRIGAQAEALRRGAEALQKSLAQAKAEIGGAEALGDPTPLGRREPEPEPGSARPPSPALTVVGEAPEEISAREAPASVDVEAGRGEAAAGDAAAEPDPAPGPEADLAPEPPARIGTPAGARLLATQMAVSGSSREEIEARLRNGFAITDARPILDAILGPEN
jgi:vacuolar-type H+-ATPase subunit H